MPIKPNNDTIKPSTAPLSEVDAVDGRVDSSDTAASGATDPRSKRTDPAVPGIQPEEHFYQQGKAHYALGKYTKSCKLLGRAAEIYLARNDVDKYLEAASLLFRVVVEKGDGEQIKFHRNKLLELLQDPSCHPMHKAKISYSLGICAYYEAPTAAETIERFRQAVQFAVESGDKDSLAYPLYGIANVYYASRDYDRALKELDSLDLILGFKPVSDLICSSRLLRGFIYRNRSLGEEALSNIWLAIEHLRSHPNIYLNVYALYALGTTYHRMEQNTIARLYLDLAVRSFNHTELPRLSKLVHKALADCVTPDSEKNYDLVFDSKTGALSRTGHESIQLQGQFILRQLLHLFMSNPGKVFSKQDLAESIWKEAYSPFIHDNKIYVTLKRLRRLLEPIQVSPTCIVRTQAGYCFNENVKTLVL